jgi:hypothetical protein
MIPVHLAAAPRNSACGDVSLIRVLAIGHSETQIACIEFFLHSVYNEIVQKALNV